MSSPRAATHAVGRLPTRARAARRFLALLGAVLAGSGCGNAEPMSPRPNLIVVLIDALRRDHLGIYGYPRDTSPVIDGLAREGLLFENAVAQSAWTLPSVASLFTSRYPPEVNDSIIDGAVLKTVSDSFPSLAGILSGAGYRTLCVSSNPYFVPVFGLTRGFDEKVFLHGGRADAIVDRGIEMIDSVQLGGGAPFFLYLHFMDVHAPNNPPPPFDGQFPTLDSAPHDIVHRTFAFTDAEQLDSDEFATYRSHKLALYDGSIGFVDHEVGRLVASLRERGLFADTILWITSDHGEELWDHARFERRHGLANKGRYGVEHGHSLTPELIDVPLIAHGPGIPRGRVAQQVRNLDLMPTALAMARVDRGDLQLEGVDVVSLWRSGALAPLPAWSDTQSRAHRVISWRDPPHQYLRIDARELLFEAPSPHRELDDISASHPERLAELRGRVDRVLDGLDPARGETIRLDDDLRRRLEALGYGR